MRVVLKVHRKGVIILPKKLREIVGINEEEEVVIDAIGNQLILRALKPKVVDIDPEVVEKILREEYDLEKNRYSKMISNEKTGS